MSADAERRLILHRPQRDEQWWLRFLPRLAPCIAAFAVAFAVDVATGRRFSSVWGSITIVASLLALFPALRTVLPILATYLGVWIGFNLIRAFAEDAGIALVEADAFYRLESTLLGGTLPTRTLQTHVFNSGQLRLHDYLFTLIHLSFFFVPFALAVILLWRRRELFRRYALATALCFALGLIGFLLLPTAPPWMIDSAESEGIERIPPLVLDQIGISPYGSGAESDRGYWFEPNGLASMPSVHVAATVLVFLAVRAFGRTVSILALVYSLAMSFGVVYLGEHHVVDAVAGWVLAVASWIIIGRLGDRSDPKESSIHA